MDKNKIAIFNTGEIQSPFAQNPVVAEFAKVSGETIKYKSYGVLESALRNNYIVYVTSTRFSLHGVGRWWFNMVGASNVFLAQTWAIQS